MMKNARLISIRSSSPTFNGEIMKRFRTQGRYAAQENGIALILVLLVIGALSVLILDLNYTTRVNLHLSQNFRDDTKAFFLARGAVEAAIYWLKEDESPGYDAFCEANDPSCENSWSLDNPGMEVGDGLVQLRIRDEDGKIWINDNKNLFKNNLPGTSALPDLLIRLKDRLELQDEIFDAVQDWIDTDDQPFGYGVEADYYESLDPPYDIRNGPLLDTSELLLVKEINDSLYYGKTDQNPVGLAELFTVFSGKKINVNTAPPDILSAMADGIDGDIIAEDRIGEPFKTKGEFTNYLSQEFPGALIAKQILWDVKSTYFSAYVRVHMNKVTKFVHAVLKRTQNNVSIVYWREE